MKTETAHAHRHPLTVAAVVGSFSVALGLVVRVSGVMAGAEEGLLRSYQEAGFPITEAGQPWWSLLALLALSYGIALLLLEIPGTGRRVLLAASLLVLFAAASPVVALWGVFWSPLVALLSGVWSAFSATMWANHHPMPCEYVEVPGEGKVISIADEQERRTG